MNVACIGIEASECRSVAAIVRSQLSPERGRPFLIQIQLYGCETAPCANSLNRVDGVITVEHLQGEPIVRTVKGPPESPVFGVQEQFWGGPYQPESPKVEGVGPFDIELGHCGLLWKVDFDGSFWLPVGDVDGSSTALINADSGSIRLVDATHAVFTDAAGSEIALVRHPGAKYLWGCR